MIVTVRSDSQVLQLPLNADISLRQALDATELRVRAACGGLGTCGACLIQIVSGDFNAPTPAERQKMLPDDLANGMRFACQLRARGDGELYLQNPAPHSEWKSLDAEPLYRATGNAAITRHVYGVAVDLGTTHIRLSLWNRQSGRRIGSRYSINPRVAHGADVLTRLDADHDGQAIGQEARKVIIDGIRDILIRDMGEVSPILAEIGKVLIVGNTAMLTLVCGNSGDSLYQPENWQLPIACLPVDAEAWCSAWRTPNAEIGIAQPLAGFIGSDLLADLIATAVIEQPQPVLLADFGTNTEIALWDG
ncbi:MAG: 2Fe-2S iron-sulfur cluster-binding protein, partial [Methylobacter sp.]